MQYVYMHNYRGFNDTLIPLAKVNFLVGENSTGKSSFLKLIHLLSNPQFWLDPAFWSQADTELGGFFDMVSALATDKTSFEIGVVEIDMSVPADRRMIFTVLTFIERNGSPKLSRFIRLLNNRMTTLVFDAERAKFHITNLDQTLLAGTNPLTRFRDLLDGERNRTSGLSRVAGDYPTNVPPTILDAMVRSMENGEKNQSVEFRLGIPHLRNVVWLAPIRSKPKRFYDGLSQSFSSEGDHIPFLIRRTLRTKSKSARFTERLVAFGKASGLFETIKAQTFGRSAQAPIEILVRFSGAELNISNVGYGVSQVLPLIVEFLTHNEQMTFAVQQPEVHLHPRAQAALGDLIFELAKERSHSFLLETHSDYLIDRYRLAMKGDKLPPDTQVVFFQRAGRGNLASVVQVLSNGRYPAEQPKEFRQFFIREEMQLIEI